MLFNALTGRYINLRNKVERLSRRTISENVSEAPDESRERLDQARKELNALNEILRQYISYIPGERTRECMRLMYMENWTNRQLSDHFNVNPVVITRELICGRQIVSALYDFEQDKVSKRKK